jgi:hypothetical protein
MASYEVVMRGAAMGVVITASHNPWMDNGFKVKSPTGAAAGPDLLKRIGYIQLWFDEGKPPLPSFASVAPAAEASARRRSSARASPPSTGAGRGMVAANRRRTSLISASLRGAP